MSDKPLPDGEEAAKLILLQAALEGLEDALAGRVVDESELDVLLQRVKPEEVLADLGGAMPEATEAPRRRQQEDFLARGRAALVKAKATGEDETLDAMRTRLRQRMEEERRRKSGKT